MPGGCWSLPRFIGAAFVANIMGANLSLAAPVVAPSVAHLDMRDPKCAVQAAARDEAVEHSKSLVRMLDGQMVVNQRFDNFMKSRKWKPKISVGEQMTPTQANEFGNLQEQIKIGLLSLMFESKRDRDIRVLGRMAELARQMKGGFAIPKEATEDHLLAALISAGREVMKLSENDQAEIVARQGKCDFENAAIAEARRTLDSIDKIPGLRSAIAEADTLGAKYGKPIDADKLDEDEKVTFDRARAAIEAATRRAAYYEDLLFVSRLEAVSKLQRDVRRRSQFEAPGDNAHANTVWEAWRKDGKISADQNKLSSVLNFINEKIPTEMMKDMDSHTTK